VPFTSLQCQCIAAVQAEIIGLNLAGLTRAQVYAKKFPTDRNVTLPAVICSLPPNEGEQMVGGLNEREDIGYPVFVTILKAENGGLEIDADMDTTSLWRETIMRHFHDKNPVGQTQNVASVYTCKVEPRQIMDFSAFIDRNVYAGGMVVRCLARQTRV
jgi:hypothetical protein